MEESAVVGRRWSGLQEVESEWVGLEPDESGIPALPSAGEELAVEEGPREQASPAQAGELDEASSEPRELGSSLGLAPCELVERSGFVQVARMRS